MMLRRGEFAREGDALVETATGRRVFLRGVNVPAKLPPFEHGLEAEDAQTLRSLGFTAVRLGVAWEALEPEEGKYDHSYMQRILRTVRICAAHDVAVVIDPHQDCWSRFTGGDGAPRWTLERLGIRVNNLEACAAAVEEFKDGHSLLWSTNYQLFGAAAMFTLFFGSRRFAPRVCSSDGQAAQQWLQDHFIEAFAALAAVLKAEPNVIGFGTMNEPSLGWIGVPDLRRVPTPYRFGYGLSPMECIRLANGESIWGVVFYGYPFIPTNLCTLNPSKIQLCSQPFWTPTIAPNHFALGPGEDPVALFLHPFWDAFGQRIRECGGEGLHIFTEEPPAVFSPPARKPRPSHEIPSPHYYDFVTLALRRFLSWLSIDFSTGWPTFDAHRARHNTVARLRAVAIGETGVSWLGNAPSTNAALHATFRALESNLVPAVFVWCYIPNHTADDGWHREDFSVWSNHRLRLHAAVRPYAARLAGRPLEMTWDGERFVLRFTDEGRADETILFFPHLMRLTVSDGCCFTEGDLVRYYHARYGVEHTIQGVVEKDQIVYV